MAHELDKYDIVEVTFNDSRINSGHHYSYKMHASMKPTKGDVCVVESPYNGFVTVTVQNVISKNSYGASRATKWIIDKVDCRFHHTLMDMVKERKAELERAAAHARKVSTVEELMKELPANSKAKKLLRQAIASL